MKFYVLIVTGTNLIFKKSETDICFLCFWKFSVNFVKNWFHAAKLCSYWLVGFWILIDWCVSGCIAWWTKVRASIWSRSKQLQTRSRTLERMNNCTLFVSTLFKRSWEFTTVQKPLVQKVLSANLVQKVLKRAPPPPPWVHLTCSPQATRAIFLHNILLSALNGFIK